MNRFMYRLNRIAKAAVIFYGTLFVIAFVTFYYFIFPSTEIAFVVVNDTQERISVSMEHDDPEFPDKPPVLINGMRNILPGETVETDVVVDAPTTFSCKGFVVNGSSFIKKYPCPDLKENPSVYNLVVKNNL